MENKAQLNCVMLGSVPVSLEEVTLAPAMIGAIIKNKGHKFEFVDCNLELFEHCDRDRNLYYDKSENLKDVLWSYHHDKVLVDWFDFISKKIQSADVLIVNVFSYFGQAVALKFIQIANSFPDKKQIFVGGLGAATPINLVIDQNATAKSWIEQTFPLHSDLIFGRLLLRNGLIDHWQQDASTSVLEQQISQISNTPSDSKYDYAVYDLDRYDWPGGARRLPILGSYGCVRKCAFCDVIVFFPKYKFIDADQLTKDIVRAVNITGINKFDFTDSLVNGSLSNFENLLKNLVHSKEQGWISEDFTWSGTYICRPPSKRQDRIHKLLKKSGVDNLIIGVESGSDKIRFEMVKKFTNNDLFYELDAFRKEGIKCNLLFFPSWPTETLEDFNETLELLKNIEPYNFSGTVNSVQLSAHGFALIGNTPIDDSKEEIGLVSGPLPWLWKCAQNPSLNFYESIRRRILSAETAFFYGAQMYREAGDRRTLASTIEQNYETILEYCGKLESDVMDASYDLEQLPNKHLLQFDVINSGDSSVFVTVKTANNTTKKMCQPGSTSISMDFVKDYRSKLLIEIDINFAKSYVPELRKHENGEYYSATGVYLNNVFIDKRNITLSGFNELVTNTVVSDITLPDDFNHTVNQRCIIDSTKVSMLFENNHGVHDYLWRITNSVLYQEKCNADKKLKQALDKLK